MASGSAVERGEVLADAFRDLGYGGAIGHESAGGYEVEAWDPEDLEYQYAKYEKMSDRMRRTGKDAVAYVLVRDDASVKVLRERQPGFVEALLKRIRWSQPSQIKRIDILGRRWFQRTYGNTYHSVEIWIDDNLVHKVPFAYGYDRMYEQTAIDWLAKFGYLPKEAARWPTRRVAEDLGIEIESTAVDVDRKRDL